MNSENYWETRNKILTRRKRKTAVREVYKKSYSRIDSEINYLYNKLENGKKLSRTELYRFSAYMNFRKELSGISEKLVGTLNERLGTQMLKAYKDAGLEAKHFLGKEKTWSTQNKHMAKACVAKSWCGSSFSKRLYKNRDELARTVQRSVEDSILNGRSKTDVKREIMERFNVSYHRADTLVRTEIMHTLNTAQVDTYKDEGVSRLDFLVEPGCCPLCAEIAAGNPYDIDNLPCIIRHPNCRCTWIPHFDDIEDKELGANSNVVVDLSKISPQTVAKSSKGGIIKNIEIDDFEMMASTKNISDEVTSVITDTIQKYEKNNEIYINDFYFGSLSSNDGKGTPLLQVEPIADKTLRLNVNTDILGGSTLEEINNKLANTKDNLAQNLQEAVIHECGHAKLIKGLTLEEIKRLYKELENINIEGVSNIAYGDGVECFAEIEILRSRKIVISSKIIEFYNKYVRR